MPKLTVDGVEVEVPAGSTVLQACEAAGAEVPRFCYHERLSVAGNCRMCLVDLEKAPKPIASCAFPAGDGMVVRTGSERAVKARQGVMEFLLINHPLDCPICDQGGECDLQDQAMAYGFDRSRYSENKRAVRDKEFGPLVKTIMTRCIHCTRCVRFATEVAGVEELGATGRGEDMEIGTYVEKALSSELSGNIIDLCPVGALTSKPYAFAARPWELRRTETIDVSDAVGSNIIVQTRGSEVMRVLPRLNEDVNEEWISDKARFSCDGLRRRRLDRPYVRDNGKLRPASWREALSAVAGRLTGTAPSRVAAIAGDQCDAESMFLLRELMNRIGSPNLDCRQDGAKLLPGVRASYLFNTTIAGIEEADACLLIGANPRWEAPIINARLRKRYLMGDFQVGLVGPWTMDMTYALTHLGDGANELLGIANNVGDDGSPIGRFAQTLRDAERPILILGQSALCRPDGAAVLSLARRIAETFGMVGRETADGHLWNGFNVLHTAASRVAGLDLGMAPGQGGRDVAGIVAGAGAGEIDVVYLLGADEIDTQALGGAFVVYQGHHGDAGARRADVVFPGAAYTEKDGIYVNTEGRAQLGLMAVHPPGEAREDWKILRALSEAAGRTLPYDTLEEVRAGLARAAPSCAALDVAEPAAWGAFGTPADVRRAAFTPYFDNFYVTDPISRASPTMAQCTETFISGGTARTGTGG